MPYGQLGNGPGAITPIALPQGRFGSVAFLADNGLQGLPPARLRVGISQGGGVWAVQTVTVDSALGQTVVAFPVTLTTDGLSIRREDAGDVNIGWEVS